MKSESNLTCPHCGQTELLKMPEDKCQHSHKCNFCFEIIDAKSSDCCVFCSYGDVPCPPMQDK